MVKVREHKLECPYPPLFPTMGPTGLWEALGSLEGWPRLWGPRIPSILGVWTPPGPASLVKSLLLCSVLRHWLWGSSLGLGSRRGLSPTLSPKSFESLSLGSGSGVRKGSKGRPRSPPELRTADLPAPSPFLTCQFVSHQCYQPTMWPSEDIPSRKSLCDRKEGLR